MSEERVPAIQPTEAEVQRRPAGQFGVADQPSGAGAGSASGQPSVHGSTLALYEPFLVEAAAEIRQVAGPALLAVTCAVGRIIFERIYGGDLERWRSRGPKDASLRRLADLLVDVGTLSVAKLYRCVAVHLVVTELGVPTSEHLTASHFETVLPLPSDRRRELLARAGAEAWSVRRLASEARVRARSRGRASQGPTMYEYAKQVQALALVRILDDRGGLDNLRAPQLAEVCAIFSVARNRFDEFYRAAAALRDARLKGAKRRPRPKR